MVRRREARSYGASRLTSRDAPSSASNRTSRGDWIALLECGHRQHVRHRPPWQEREWVVTAAGRRGRLGAPLECVDCEVMGEEGGAPACGADMVRPECGAVEEEGHCGGCAGDSPDDTS